MKLAFSLAAALVAATALVAPQRAHACGGCFHQPNETTQVSGHRMILSVSPMQTTLWDQIQYVGNPTDFAWILPVHGTVTIGLSSDGLFSQLDALTDEQVAQPPYPCANGGQQCDSTAFAATSAGSGFGTGGSGGGVTVIAQSVVGPYETVQLHSTDPNALANWLASHGYELTASVKPVVDAYIAEGFDFLALKLVPGQGVGAMRPVRITTAGAGLSLPLRMVAAGTGAMTPIKLWVFAQGRYEPSNMPKFKIDSSQIVWDWATNSSNLSALREAGFAATNNRGWLVESSQMVSESSFGQLQQLVESQPTASGYGDDTMGTNAQANKDADFAALFGGLGSQLVLTRLDAELSHAALANDLLLGASADQGLLSPTYYPTATKNAPTCPPPPPPCNYNTVGSGASGGSGGAGAVPGPAGGCSVNGGTGMPVFGLAAIGLAVALRRRRAHIG